jgi:hypothetical protein
MSFNNKPMARYEIFEYFQEVIRKIDIHVEKMIAEINEKRIELISKVHFHQESVLEQLEKTNLEENTDFIKQVFSNNYIEFEETNLISHRLVGIVFCRQEIISERLITNNHFELTKYDSHQVAFTSTRNGFLCGGCSCSFKSLNNGFYLQGEFFESNDVRFTIISISLKVVSCSKYFINLALPNSYEYSRPLIVTSNQKFVIAFDNQYFTRICVFDIHLNLLAKKDFFFKLNNYVANKNYILVQTFEEDRIRVLDFDLKEVKLIQPIEDSLLFQFTDSNQMLAVTKTEEVFKVFATSEFGENIFELGESYYPFISINNCRLLNQHFLVHLNSDTKVLSLENLRKKASKRISLPDIDIESETLCEMDSEGFILLLRTSKFILKFKESIFFE